MRIANRHTPNVRNSKIDLNLVFKNCLVLYLVTQFHHCPVAQYISAKYLATTSAELHAISYCNVLNPKRQSHFDI